MPHEKAKEDIIKMHLETKVPATLCKTVMYQLASLEARSETEAFLVHHPNETKVNIWPEDGMEFIKERAIIFASECKAIIPQNVMNVLTSLRVDGEERAVLVLNKDVLEVYVFL